MIEKVSCERAQFPIQSVDFHTDLQDVLLTLLVELSQHLHTTDRRVIQICRLVSN
jgi:hypothetical protein